jgi:ATP-binding cassette subfamily B protein
MTAAVKTGLSLSFLNIGQAALITTGLVIVMAMSALGVQAGKRGDFVMVNAYMIQITMPLNFLGTVYREIRQALVDMGEMFALRPTGRDHRCPDAQPLHVKAGEITSTMSISPTNPRGRS